MTDDPIDKRRSTLAGMGDVVGTTGLRLSGGAIIEEFLPELRGQRGARTFREMADNESTLGAVIFVVTTLLRQAS
ncbi:hypothetical protein [Rubellimicrobium sp. CFH 75288]|uniref:hypothetical protein n=1 Tax=Rubellimicrobium sp. CFH 75288 TaxID=2697034 RepID=UPI001411F41F|nr:hypothetical protein [Rubellimicrobium sp. CFH 75288]NAZ37163.1 hypothetical protein [Rubellimicrobium sp. CFH 75288]